MITFDDIDNLVGMSVVGAAFMRLDARMDWLRELGEIVYPHVKMRMNYYMFLYNLVMARKPFVALELGVEYGLASAYMSSAAMDCGGHVVGIDLNWHNIPGEEIDKFCGNYTFINGDSTTAGVVREVSAVVREFGKIGVVFQDSSHHYVPSCIEWKLYNQFLDKNAIWVCDDITPAFQTPDEPKGMVDYFQERPGQKKLYPDVLHKGNTVGVILL